MNTTRKDLEKLFEELGVKKSENWTDARMKSKVEALGRIDEEDLETQTPASAKLLKAILAALDKDEAVEWDEGGDGKPEEAGKSSTKSAATKAAAAKTDGRKASGKTDPKKAAAEAKTDGKKASGKKEPKADGKPGVIASIIEFLGEATEDNPMTKDEILAKLVARFPERGRDSMRVTVAAQVPQRLKIDKELKVEKTGKVGYYIRG